MVIHNAWQLGLPGRDDHTWTGNASLSKVFLSVSYSNRCLRNSKLISTASFSSFLRSNATISFFPVKSAAVT